MKKFVASFAALVLFGSFAATSGAFASTQDGAKFAENDDGQSVEGLGISEEERVRREEVCYTGYLACCDQCKRTLGGSPCYNQCSVKHGECLAAIPDRDE